MEDPLDSYPLSACRHVSPMKRNPVCALTYGVCADLCHEFGGLQFDIRKSVITADSLCAYLAQNAWDPPDAEQCYQWLVRHITNSPPTIMCACAIVSVTISRLTDAPDSLIALGRGMRCLIYGPGNCIYDNLCSAAEENNIDLSLSAYVSTPILRTLTPSKQPKHMQATQNNQYNAPVYQGCTFTTHNTTNNFYGAPPSSSASPDSPPGSSSPDPDDRPEKTWRDILGIPKPNKYSEVRRHILERLKFDEEFREFYADATRVELCQRLSEEFGWFLDPNSLGKNMNRKH